MSIPVLCPKCQEFSQIPALARGQTVLCPFCNHSFRAESSTFEIPTVYPKPTKVTDDFDYRIHDQVDPTGPKNVLFGLALLPFIIPLLWILGPTITGKEAIFTFTLPMAIAISSTGLCMGIVLAAEWTFATRVKGILAIVLVMHFCSGFLYFLKTEWVELIRKELGRANEDRWIRFVSKDRKFAARVPSPMREGPAVLLDGIPMEVYQTSDVEDPATYIVAHGRQPVELNEQPDQKFFDEMRDKATAASGGTLVSETEARLPGYPGREMVFQLAERNTRRIIRVYRIERTVLATAVEGAFLTHDAGDVKIFFDHIEWNPRK